MVFIMEFDHPLFNSVQLTAVKIQLFALEHFALNVKAAVVIG